MKIAIVVGSFPTISETFILNQITGLIDLGHSVDIFAFFKGKNEKVHSEVYKYNLLERTYYFDIPERRIKRMIKTTKILLCYFTFYPLAIIKSLNFKKYGGKYYALNNLFKLTPFLRKKYDVIHCHFGPIGNEMVFIKDIFPNMKFIVTFHGYDVSSYVREKGDDIYQKLFKKVDFCTYNSEATRNKLIKLGCPDDLMVKIPMGVKLDKFVFRKRKIKSDEKINILSVGRLVEMKGREYAIRAVAKIIRKFRNVNYKIVGDGPLYKQLYTLIKDLHTEDNIQLLNRVGDKELEYLFNISHLFLHPSIKSSDGNMEGQGVVLLEAQACGLPVVATRHNAFPESIIEGKTGFLVPERDVDAIVKKLEYLITHPEIWTEMGKAGRKFVEENFDIKKLNKKLVEIYELL